MEEEKFKMVYLFPYQVIFWQTLQNINNNFIFIQSYSYGSRFMYEAEILYL